MWKGWDCETTIKERFKRKASPFHPENWVVTHAWRGKDDAQVVEVRFGRERPPPGWLLPVLKDTRILCGFNIKFDLLHALQCHVNLDAWMSWIAGGGQIWDCQLAEYLLEGMTQENHMLSLDEVTVRYGGDLKVDEVKALWQAGVSTEDIEPELLSRYLCGGEDEHGVMRKGDIDNTVLIALSQIKRARAAGQLNSIMLNMGALVASTEMERNGMFIDTRLGEELATELREQMAALRLSLDQFLPDLPFQFSWTSRYHKSALIFGGSVNYDRREYQLIDGTYTFDSNHPEQAYTQKDAVMVTAAADFNHGKAGYLLSMDDAKEWDVPVVRFAGGKNAGEVKTKTVKVPDLTKPKSRMGRDEWYFPGYTKGQKKWETAEPGVYSVGEEVIEELGAQNVPFLQALAKLTKVTKDLGTYFYVVDDKGNKKGMLSLVDEYGVIHHKINHTSTVTGRFSSSDPNLQNVPKGNNSKVKLVFVSRFGKDGAIIQSDFSSLEVYVQAILTECKQLIADLKAGLDMHVKRLAVKEGIGYEECLLLCKGNNDVAAVPEWDVKRTGAKVFSFQRAYGAGAAKIAGSTGMALEDVEALIKAEDIEYPEIGEFYINLTDTIKRSRKSTGRVIPHPDLPGVMCHIGRGSYRTPDGKLYVYSEHPAPEFVIKRNPGQTSNFSPTEIRNYCVQGAGGEWMKAAMWLAVKAFYSRRNFEGRALLVNTVHDAMYADADARVKFEAAVVIHACMEAASDFMEFYFNWPIPVPVPSDTSWGPSMMDEEKIPGLKEAAAKVRVQLRADYMKGYVPSFATH